MLFSTIRLERHCFQRGAYITTRLISLLVFLLFLINLQTIMFSVFRRTAVEVAESSLKGIFL